MSNVCFVHNVGAVGGAERVSQMIMSALSDSHNFFLACPETGLLTKECEALGVTTCIHNIQQPEFTRPFATYKGYREWLNIIEEFNVDVFHTGDLLSTRSLMAAAQKKDVKVIVHVHFPFSQDFAEWVFKGRPHPDAFIFCSQELQTHLGDMLTALCPQSQQIAIHNGVDIAKFPPVKPTEGALKRIGIIANLQERKGHDDFIEMANILTQQGYDLTFDIVGGDILEEPREQLLKDKGQQLGLSDKFNFHGQVTNVKDYLADIDIYICASHEEAFPISILEAMASEKPIVSTDVNGIPEALEDGVTGHLVPLKSPEKLAEKVAMFIDNPDTAIVLGKAARQKVIDNFTTIIFAQRINEVYENL